MSRKMGIKETEREKVVIIGGGPAGLAAAVYTARAGLNPLVLAGSPPGGQLMLTSEVENYPGFQSILGPELISKMRQQGEKFGARLVDQNVKRVNFSKRPLEIFLSNSREGVSSLSEKLSEKRLNPTPTDFNQLQPILTKSVIIATGARALWLGVPGEERLRGKGVSACATCDGFFFKDKIVAVVGGGDTAMEEGLTLTKFAKKVYIIHRRDQFRASTIMQERVFRNPKIEIVWNAQVKEVLGEEKVEGVRLEIKIPNSKFQDTNKHQMPNSNFQKIEEKKIGNWNLVIGNLPLDGLFIAIGHKPDTDIFKEQIELDKKGYVITSQRLMEEYAKLKVQRSKFKVTIQDSKLEELIKRFNLNYRFATSREGVFAAGDCVDYLYRQAGTAVGMGIAAGLEAERWLDKTD